MSGFLSPMAIQCVKGLIDNHWAEIGGFLSHMAPRAALKLNRAGCSQKNAFLPEDRRKHKWSTNKAQP
jgi:hypothetical protein